MTTRWKHNARRMRFSPSLPGGEPLEQRRLLAVTASVTSGELRIGFTPSAAAEQVARLSSDGTKYTVRNTNNVSIGTFAVSAVNSITVTGLTAVERFEIPSTSTREIADPITVAATVETTAIGRAIATSSGGVQIGSPAITLTADVTTAAAQTYAGNVTLATGSIVTASTGAADIRFESTVTGVSGSVLVVETAGSAVVLGGLSGSARLVKRGVGGLRLPSAAAFDGGTAVEAGELTVARTKGLGAGGLQVTANAKLKLDAGTSLLDVASLTASTGGQIDIGVGGLRIAAGGYDLAAVRSMLVTGRAGGSWQGASGIVSRDATAASGRSIGMVVGDDGSLRVAFGADGDTNIDGYTDALDATNMLTGAKFDTGRTASWTDGDNNYDEVFDILDVANFFTNALYDAGPYLPVSTVPTRFSEAWESLATATLPASAWQLQTGGWGAIEQQDVRNAGRKHAVAAGQATRLMRPVDLAAQDHVVLQGWLFSTGTTDRSMLGLASFPTVTNNALVQMGATGKSTYRIEYGNLAAGSAPIEIDTTLPVEAGWHFMRLDLVRDTSDATLWQATWRGWNTARTIEKTQSFSWRFDSAGVNWATLGSAAATAGTVAWDNVDVGPLGKVGPPPALPATASLIVGTASSNIAGWEPSKAVDGNVGTIYSSTSRGATAVATEWVALDVGKVATMSGLKIYPRGNACFPVDYQIQSSTDMITWTTVPGMTFTDQTAPATSVTHAFSTPIQARGLRIYATKLSSDGVNHYLQIADMQVPEFLPSDLQAWVSPAELRDKKVINTGIFSRVNPADPDWPSPQYLATHPDYLANTPFDGLTIPVPIDQAWTTSQGLVSQPVYGLNQLTMLNVPIPWSVVEGAVNDLKQVQWGHVTDNFLWYGFSEFASDEDAATKSVNPSSSADWNVVVQNAAICARMCREAGLKGFMMDPEQYGHYPTGEYYPFGLGSAATWRSRGEQWIKAVQSEYPEILLNSFFSWGPESEPGGWDDYPNLSHFMDGVLAGIEAPARIIHGWESTFWYGMNRTVDGVPTQYAGDRTVYAQTRSDIRNSWRAFSDNPAKYDAFVDVGMAAWVDSDPYNLPDGWPTGFLNDPGPWSNLAATLAYSDEYVWTWSEHTNYPQTRGVLNPFLASLANRTFNTGAEQATAFTEDFTTDPMKNGWSFDFNMLDIGRDIGRLSVAMTTDSLAYAWSQADGAVDVRGNWKRGAFDAIEGLAAAQRRRYTKPIEAVTRSSDIHSEIDFTVEAFGSDPDNPILLGLFHSQATTDRQSLCLRIIDGSTASIVLAGDGTPFSLPLTPVSPLTVGTNYRVVLDYAAATRTLSAQLLARGGMTTVATATATVPATVGSFVLDEAGLAQRETAIDTLAAQAHRFRLDAFAFGAALPAQAATAASGTTSQATPISSTELALAALAYEQPKTVGTTGAKKRLI